MELARLPAESVPIAISVIIVLAYLGLMQLVSRGLTEKRHSSAGWQESERRAEALLSELLPAGELRRLREAGYLEVTSERHVGRVYRIPRYQGPVAVYEEGSLTYLLCVRSVEPIPNADVVLLHKLMIEGDEEAYLEVANPIHPRTCSFTA